MQNRNESMKLEHPADRLLDWAGRSKRALEVKPLGKDFLHWYPSFTIWISDTRHGFQIYVEFSSFLLLLSKLLKGKNKLTRPVSDDSALTHTLVIFPFSISSLVFLRYASSSLELLSDELLLVTAKYPPSSGSPKIWRSNTLLKTDLLFPSSLLHRYELLITRSSHQSFVLEKGTAIEILSTFYQPRQWLRR